MHRSTSFLIALCALLAAGCVGYRTQVVRVESSAAALPTTPSGPLAFEDAVRLLVDRNPQLKATRAAVLAVNTRPGPSPLLGRTRIQDGNMTEATLRTDVLSLFGIGPRATQIALARAVRDERVRRHHERARDLVAELAEAYAIEHVLRGLPAPQAAIDVSAFEQAGLASRSLLAAARSVEAEGNAEAEVIAARLADVRREVAHLVGAAPQTDVRPEGVTDAWPQVAEPERERLVLARGDLQRLLASWRVADRAYRHQVQRQIPNVIFGLGGNVDLGVPLQLIQVELPLDAPEEARAAEHARRVAFHELEAGILDAVHEAASGRFEVQAAEARLRAATERRSAARELLAARKAKLETDPEALESVVLVAGRLVDAARAQREAAVAVARARVHAARAAGWPTPADAGMGGGA
ncbi:MAG: hypothetical protein QNJ90_03045 [Planctomycetota bacterium]|nr:hypothetical protein [Planctomycetota bacterium]